MRAALLIFLLLFFPPILRAQEAARIAAGPRGGTYIRVATDLARIAAEEDVTLEVLTTGGSVDNLKQVTAPGRQALLGIVQSDVLGFLQRSDNANSRRIAEGLRLVAPLYPEEVHVLAHRGIASFADLAGKRIVVGAAGSGSMITAVNLLDLAGIEAGELYQLPPAEAAVAVLGGQADGMIFVSGKPVRLFKNMETLSEGENAELLREVHFLPLTDSRFMREFTRATLNPQDYAFLDRPVQTLAVTSSLVTYRENGKQSATRCDALGRIGLALRKHIEELRSSGHAKWREVRLTEATRGWKHDACAWPESR